MESAFEPLSDAELFALGEDEALDRVLDLVALQNRVTAELTRAVRVAHARQLPERDGLKSMTSWLVGHARMQPAAAARLVSHGRALTHLPALDDAFATGAVSPEQVTVAAKAVTPERVGQAADQGVDVGVIDAVLAGVATTQPFEKLGQAVERYLAQLDPDGPEPAPTDQRALRITRHDDGSVTGSFELDAVGGEKVRAVLEPMVATGRSAGDERTKSQQYGDAFVQWADNTLAGGDVPVLRTRKPQIGVVIALDDLVAPTTGPATAQMGFGAVISAARARWVACDGEIGRIVMGPDGVPIDLGRGKRVVDAHLRKAVDLRDRGCVFAGCTAPPWWCSAHHILEWLFGGKTNLENVALLCERHHAKVHHGFRIERQPDGRWRTWRPDGTEILIGESLLAAA